MYIVNYSERVYMARMHEPASASPPYERVPNILRYTFNNLFLCINGYITIYRAPINNIQDRPAFHFALVNVKTIISSALAGYSCSSETPPIGVKWQITLA